MHIGFPEINRVIASGEDSAAVNAAARAAAAKLTEKLFPGRLASDVLSPVRSKLPVLSTDVCDWSRVGRVSVF